MGATTGRVGAAMASTDGGAPESAPAAVEPTGWATTADGVEIAYYELGGRGPAVVLAHATGFCAAVLVPVAKRLMAAGWRCMAFDARGHGRSGRPADGDFSWSGFATDVLTVTERLELEAPFGFGHSCGGAALLLGEERRPGTFRALYCYEPIVYAGHPPPEPRLEGNPLAEGALRRREWFASYGEARGNFAGKAPFDRLDDEVLSAYVANGFGPAGGGVALRCRREDEAAVYGHSLAHDAFAHLGELRCPVTLAGGAETDAIGPSYLARLAAPVAEATVEVFPGLGHFGPLEDPAALARSVAAAAGGVGGTGRSRRVDPL